MQPTELKQENCYQAWVSVELGVDTSPFLKHIAFVMFEILYYINLSGGKHFSS
ncbi:hypothetical protein NC651_021410 [Populus alba x Populus x berolinensis]|nr:hypothetical protein NC651_021410 [Populus alba x Populus x berolinensis]